MLTRADEPRITVTWDRASIADVVAGAGNDNIVAKVTDAFNDVNAALPAAD